MTAATEPAEPYPSSWAWDNVNREDAPGYERSDSQQDYEVLRDTIIQAFNPPDDDVAEPSLMTDTLDRVWSYILAQPCTCTPEMVEDGDPCERCGVLGRIGNERVDR